MRRSSRSERRGARGVRSCVPGAGLVFKATAGLHHAVRSNGEHGFLNLLAAVVFEGREEAALAETDPDAFALDADGFSWHGQSVGASELARVRHELFHSIGSCSFFEPVEELDALGNAPADDRRESASASSRSAATRRASGSASGTASSTSRRTASAQVFERADTEPVSRARPHVVGGHDRAHRRARSRGSRSRPSRRRRRRPSVHGRRLRRLLLVARARDEPRTALPAGRGAAASELAPPAGRLPRPRRDGRRQRNADRAPVRPGEAADRGRSALRAEPAARHRARARLRRRSRQSSRRAGAHGGVPRPRLRRRARQRLERARHPGLGVPAARPVPRKVVRDVDRRLGDAARAARGPVRPGAAAGSGAAAVPP